MFNGLLGELGDEYFWRWTCIGNHPDSVRD
jgi:hypothetical protein